jgi:hypothetical protein
MSTTSSPTDTRKNSITDISGTKVRKFLNGWTKEQEHLMAQWADVASCYRWLHDRAEKKYTRLSMCINIPVIVLSTLTGAANFAVGSFIPSDDASLKNYVSAGLGAVSIATGIITTLGNFFQYAQKSEANRVASIAWGKFQRLVSVELAINPDDRLEAMDFLKICRQDLDRLIEQSPPISDDVIKMFETEFHNIPNLKVPDICHGIEHTRVFNSSNTRLGKIAAEAALHLRYKKSILANSVLPNIDKKLEEELNGRIERRIRELIPSATTPPPEREDSHPVTGVVAGLEQDWRKLLVTKRHILTSQPPPQVQYQPPELNTTITTPEEVRLNIVGTDGPITNTSPSSSASVVSGASIAEGATHFPVPPMFQRRPPPPPPEPVVEPPQETAEAQPQESVTSIQDGSGQ